MCGSGWVRRGWAAAPALRLDTTFVMTPRCPLVLAVLASGPRRAHEIARAIGAESYAAHVSLGRLERAGLVRRRSPAGQVEFLLTARGRRELRLHRLLWSRVILRDVA